MKVNTDIFHAIADPRRRAIILLVAAQAMTPNALAGHFECSRQAVSKHIRVLAESQVLKQEKSGREIYYSLNRKKMDEIDRWLDLFRQNLEKRFSQLDRVLTKSKTRK